jgi:hypothetical protein
MCIYAHVCKSGIIMNRALDPKIHFLIIRFFGNERRSVPRLQLHLGDIAYKFVVLYLFYYICLFQFLKHDHKYI